MSPSAVLRVAVPGPFPEPLDYLPPAGLNPSRLAPGTLLVVPLGRRRVVGVLLETAEASAVPATKLRAAHAPLPDAPALTPELVQLARWASEYYRHPIGEVFEAVVPVAWRDPSGSRAGLDVVWQAVAASTPPSLARAPRQAEALAVLHAAGTDGMTGEMLDAALGDGWATALRALEKRGHARRTTRVASPAPVSIERASPPPLNAAQQAAVDEIAGTLGSFTAVLLDGVTGSGKTEVYLHAVEAALARGTQALVLVPEIGLTPQAVARFRARLGAPVAVLHSGLAEGERLAAWRAVREGAARVVLGTRSALWAPLAELGLVIVDEEQDSSYKQQEGFRYSARDLAVLRAQRANAPVVLGSATPSLESLANVEAGRYRRIALPERAGAARHPKLELVDLRGRKLNAGLSDTLVKRVEQQLGAGGQALLFLNRRGYAPTLTCHDCGFVAGCRRCDAKLVVHKRHGELRCHHCGAQQALPAACPSCGSAELVLAGRGTERIEEWLAQRFPDAGVARIDRDTTRRKGALERLLDDAQSGRARLLIGTQMLAKGHDFPDVGLVGIVDVDQGLYGVDFRAAERMAQLIVQVAGRAGRADRPGEVLIQTRHPEHPLLTTLLAEGYPGFAAAALAERRAAGWPPYGSLALLRAEAPAPAPAEAFLVAARDAAAGLGGKVEIAGPAPAPMERRAGRHRWQLLLRADARGRLQGLLAALAPRLRALPEARKVRWTLDVDPTDLA
jgi:primosomal protein N' (replication factor Y)